MQADAPVRNLVAFGRLLRQAGLDVGAGRLAVAMAGLDRVGIGRREDVYWTLRQTLVSREDDLETFDRAFAAWFDRIPVPLELRRRVETPQVRVADTAGARPEGADAEGEDTAPGWTAEERLRRKDFASLSEEEFARLRALVAGARRDRPRRRTRRLRAHPSGSLLDLRRLARRSLATGGDPVERAFRRRTLAPRKLVLLCDVSGSMEPYTRALLLFVHALIASGPRVEAFAFGTRLTRLTHDLRTRDPEVALAAAAERVVDWSGGTRIGASLKQFNDEWGRRALTRGAVVVVVSDGWEREDAALVSREMARLGRAAYAVVWVNPLKGHPDYQPLAAGMRAALPYVDRFVPGHNLVDLDRLAEVLGAIERRHAA